MASYAVPTPRTIDVVDDGSAQYLNEDRCAKAIVERLSALYPDDVFEAVPGGEASGDYNVLVRGKHYREVEGEMAEDLRVITSSVLCDDDSVYDWPAEA